MHECGRLQGMIAPLSTEISPRHPTQLAVDHRNISLAGVGAGSGRLVDMPSFELRALGTLEPGILQRLKIRIGRVPQHKYIVVGLARLLVVVGQSGGTGKS